MKQRHDEHSRSNARFQYRVSAREIQRNGVIYCRESPVEPVSPDANGSDNYVRRLHRNAARLLGLSLKPLCIPTLLTSSTGPDHNFHRNSENH